MKLKFVLFMVGMISLLSAQHTVSGTVIDAESSDVLIGANVIVKGTTLGAATDLDGKYEMELDGGAYSLQAMYVGYVTKEEKINVSQDITLDFGLKSDVFSREVLVTAQRAKFRETPVPFMDISVDEIEEKATTRDISMLLNNVPGVYASEQGGGSGDSRIAIRGFSTENIAVMINGVPVNDMENGRVYWSNWSGLSDVASSIQVQRGLGASKLSSSSIGGTVNVITRSTESEKSMMFKSSVGADATYKNLLTYSTGLIDDMYAMSFMVSHKTSDGTIDETWSDDWTYFASFGLNLNKHVVNLNVTGTPQEHGQRTNKHTMSTYKKNGRTWNPDWGMLNGKKFNVRQNFYHKPVIDLNHTWQYSDKTIVNNVLYASFGTGGGTGELRQSVGGRDNDGYFLEMDRSTNQLDLQSVYDHNSNGNYVNTHPSASGAQLDGAVNIIRNSINNHNWYGIISSMETEMGKSNITVGFDGRYYKGEHYREVDNLLGAQYFLDDDNENLSGDQRRYVGDIVDYHNDGFVRQYGLFGQIETKFNKKTTGFINTAFNTRGYKRKDYFDVSTAYKAETDWVSHNGWQLKGGLNYNIDDANNIFFNAGLISKVPLFDAVFINYSNTENEKVNNEKIMSFDFGIGHRSKTVAINASAYYTKWEDRFYATSVRDGNTTWRYNAYEGVGQTHMGLELDFRYKPNNQIDIEGSAVIAKNVYSDNFSIQGVDNDDNIGPLGTIYAKDLFVGNQPMKTAKLGVKYNVTDGFYINPRVRYVGKHFAEFDVIDRFNNEADKDIQAWEIPDYSKYDLTVGYSVEIKESFGFGEKLNFSLNVYNLFDKFYISDADDNGTTYTRFNDGPFRGGGDKVSEQTGNHVASSALVYYGRPRTWTVSARFSF